MDSQIKQSSGSQKKNNKSIKQQKSQLSADQQEETKKLMTQKLEEFEKIAATNTLSDDPSLKQIRLQYKKLLKSILQLLSEDGIDVKEKFDTLFDLGLSLSENSQKLDEELYVYKRQNQQDKLDQQYQKEYNQMIDLKSKLEFHCKDLQKRYQQLCDALQKLPIDEQAKREEIQKSFDGNVSEVKEKIITQEIEAGQFEEENIKLREDLKQIIASYEEREKEFWDIVKQKEDSQKSDTQRYLQRFEKMQLNAQEAIQKKLSFETGTKMLQQKKMKLSMYKGKFQEFMDTLDKSYTTIIKLKEELIKMALQVKQKEEKYTLIQVRAERADRSIVTLIEKIESAKKEVEQIKKEKDRVKSDILQVQKKLKEKDQQQQQS